MDNLTYGDYIILQLALLEKIKNVDLSMHSGQYMVELIGKIDYIIGQLQSAASEQLPLQAGPGAGPKPA